METAIIYPKTNDGVLYDAKLKTNVDLIYTEFDVIMTDSSSEWQSYVVRGNSTLFAIKQVPNGNTIHINPSAIKFIKSSCSLYLIAEAPTSLRIRELYTISGVLPFVSYRYVAVIDGVRLCLSDTVRDLSHDYDSRADSPDICYELEVSYKAEIPRGESLRKAMWGNPFAKDAFLKYGLEELNETHKEDEE